jgi:hypothetical protein
MRHNNKLFLKLMLVVVTLTTSCTKYLDVNNDPNRVTDANITPELIFTQAEVAVGARQASGNFRFVNHWIGYVSANGTFAPQQNEISYNIDFSFCDPIFVNHMNVLFDLYQAKTKALASGDLPLAGASMVLSAKLFQELVDLYGNIPYSQAFQVDKYPTPAYDKAQDIYNDLQLKLDSAIGLLGETVTNNFKNADVIAHGNTTLWIKFANTMKLRLLIRQSEVSGFNPSAEIAKIQTGGGVLGAGETISVNPGYVNDVNKQNAFYANFGWSPTGTISTSSDNANNYIVTLMGNDADPRLKRFFYPVGFSGNTYKGAVYGADITGTPPSSGLSYFGPGIVGTINGANQGDGSGAAQDQWIMTSFESMFLYAEAVARGWIAGTDSVAYKAAVTESFNWLGVPNADSAAASYMANNADANYIPANIGSTPLSKATFIAYQKYLALPMIDPLEAYADLRRLNMLKNTSYISQFSGRLSNTLPVRLLYPQSEYTTNATNVNAEGTIDQFTTKLFWEP